MFKCIHVSNFDTSNISPITNETIKSYKSKYDKILINLENLFLNSEEAFDVDKINKELFSDVQPDIFLSHSHADEKDVIKLAAKIELHTGLSVLWTHVSGQMLIVYYKKLITNIAIKALHKLIATKNATIQHQMYL